MKLSLSNIYQEVSRQSIGRIDEAGLARLLSRINGRDFAIITGFRAGLSLKQNQARNAEIRRFLDARQMGGYMLIGHWQEAPEGIDYEKAVPEDLTDVTEESILFVKPDEMAQQDFVNMCVALIRKYNQDAGVVGLTKTVGEGLTENRGDYAIYLFYKDGSNDQIGNELSLGKTAQAYSQMRNKPNVPFVFEGTLAPINVTSRMAFKRKNVLY